MAIVICIVSAFFWSLFDLTRKQSVNYYNPITILVYFLLSQLLLFFTWVLIKDNNYFIPLYYFKAGIFLAILNAFSAILFLKSIKLSDLSLLIPLLSFTPLFSAIFSIIFLGEQLFLSQYFGFLIIIIGAISLYSNSFFIKDLIVSVKTILFSRSSQYMLLVSLIWSITPVLDKVCLKYSSVNIHGFLQSLSTLILLILFYGYKVILEKIKLNKKYFLISTTVLLGLLATLFQFYAIIFNNVAIMETIKRFIGQVSSLILGNFVFKEKINLQKILGVTLLSFGVLLAIDI